MNHRTPPFPGFSRGVPIIGNGPRELPPGLHFYEVSVLVRRDGQPLDADSLEIRMEKPLDGFQYKKLPQAVSAELKRRAPDLPEPRVVIVNVWELGFVTQEALERIAAQAAHGGNGGAS